MDNEFKVHLLEVKEIQLFPSKDNFFLRDLLILDEEAINASFLKFELENISSVTSSELSESIWFDVSFPENTRIIYVNSEITPLDSSNITLGTKIHEN